MKVTRLDLDGKNAGSPEGLVTLILKVEPLSIPVPIEELCRALDIKEIADLETDGFEGGLLMDQYRRNGIILVNKAARDGRRRFTIGHELAHFLIPTHKPVKGDRFLCSRDDMRLWSAVEQDTYARMEVEANRFSALILMPPPLLRLYLAKFRDPDISQILAVHNDFIVSKDAAARAYAQYYDQPVATVVVKDGHIQRIYKSIKFPKLSVGAGDAVPKPSVYHRTLAANVELSDLKEVGGGQWLESEWGKKLPDLYEQVLHQQMGYALVLLWAEFEDVDEDEDPDENRTSKQRMADRRGRWSDR